MPSAKEFFEAPLRYFIGFVGEPGSGKTRQAIAFPRNYVAEIGDTHGLKTILEDKKNAALRQNLVHQVSLDIEDKKESKEIFAVTDDPKRLDSIYGVLAHVKAMAQDNAIDTFTLDGSSFLFDYKGAQIGKTVGGGDGDRWGYYRQLKEDLTWFVNANLMPLVSRYSLNVIINFHLQRESEEAKQKQTSRDSDMSPRIEGSFRQAMSALPRAMIYLHQSVKTVGTDQQVVYSAFCQRVKVPHVGLIPAKNSYGLPPMIDVTNKSLYEILVQGMTATAPRVAQAVKK